MALVAIKVEDISLKGCNYKAFFFSASWAQDPIYAPLWYVTVVKKDPLANFFFQPTLFSNSPAGTSSVHLNVVPNEEEC